MRRVGPSVDKGPQFFLVYEGRSGLWHSLAYWSVGAANRRAAQIRGTGRLAFVEAR